MKTVFIGSTAAMFVSLSGLLLWQGVVPALALLLAYIATFLWAITIQTMRLAQ